MSQIISKLEELVTQGALLVPQGGFDFSGYNARLQSKYLEWRKGCLEALEQAGPIGFPYKNKILGDANGGFFYQTSAHLIYVNIRELFEKVKTSPELAAEVAAAPPPAPPAEPPPPPAPTEGRRILKPPPKTGAAPATPAPAPPPAPAAAPPPQAAPAPAAETPKKVYVIGEINDPLRHELTMFLEEIKIEEIPIDRLHGEMVPVDHIKEDASAKFAFFIIGPDDLGYAMFEMGHFVGKLGKNHVCVLHNADVSVPKNIPGVIIRPISTRLEEASLSLLRDLKASGYVISF